MSSLLAYTSPCGRELCLRALSLVDCGQFGRADDYDAVDAAENKIAALSDMPALTKLKTLILTRNRIAHIGDINLPALHTLILTANRIKHFADIARLRTLNALRLLDVRHNPIHTRRRQCRLICHLILTQVTHIDYNRITNADRQTASKLIPKHSDIERFIAECDADDDDDDNDTILTTTSNGNESAAETLESTKSRLRAAIKSAESIEEIQRIEAELAKLSDERHSHDG